MGQSNDQGSTAEPEPAGSGRVSFERLRERTDELELIISGVSLIALLSLPGWLWDAYAEFAPRLGMGLVAAAAVTLPILSAICYLMALLFLMHLGVRAHWVGLIGLKAVFPEGVRWERLDGMGPLTLARLRGRLPSLDRSVARADRLASALFSLITFSALALAVLGFWLTLLFVVAGLFGHVLGGTNTFVNRAVGWLILAYLALPAARWLLDGVLVRRVPALERLALLRWLIRLLGWLESLFFPPRLLGATRLTLQSQLLPRAFFVLFVAAVIGIAYGSNLILQRGQGFDVLGNQRFVTAADTAGGSRSAYYESQRVARDRLRPQPMIPAPLIETAWLPLFLPYVALIDDPVLEARCPPRPVSPSGTFGFDPSDTDAAAIVREAEVDAGSAAAADCLRRLWEVRLNGTPQSLDGFVPSERRDLGVRGLSGWLPLNGLRPGPQRLEVIWRPAPEQDVLREDWLPRRTRHHIPFVWSPEAAALPAQE